MTIYLVRHAPTAANHGGVFMGQRDVSAIAVDSPADHRIRAGSTRIVYTSPLGRAVSAAEILFPGETAIREPLLLERAVGEWEGLDHATVEARWPGTFIDGVIDPHAAPLGGESVEDLCARVTGFFEQIAGATADVYAVTHNGWIRAAMMLNGDIGFDELFAEPVPFLTPLPFAPTFVS